ncbi:alpha-L-rhamnosidase [Niallia sp. MER 6]|uniref:alpha-L-rhamnosidase n=1 Tax=Niallia sp. MER 6 TaxID=2939567 RepID=UPI00203DC236|nr:alpha-L-rhamnosidase [Niallia sp. MER 6]MCM3033838.1 glycoside hydrolase family 78 protein [Niallia sp. MER 6]
MKVTELRINGINNPVGFSYDILKCSWKVIETKAKKQKRVKIEVSDKETFESVLYIKEGESLDSIGEEILLDCQPKTKYFYRIEVETDQGEIATSEAATFETGKMDEKWSANWIGTQKEDTFHPLFRKKFIISKDITNARFYVSGLGLYEVYINHGKVGNEYLTPLYSDYHSEYQYQTFDVTGMLTSENILEIILGNGWYKGRFGLGDLKENFGNEFACIAELHITYLDGDIEIISTDESWKYIGSDIELSDIYDGEILNRMLWNGKSNMEKEVRIVNLDKEKLISRYSIPVIEKEILSVEEIIYTPAGETVLDMGQNLSGIIEFQNRFPKGTKLIFDFGEILQNGNFYNANYRSAKSQFIYISDGTIETVRPHFTFFGFRYIRVIGWIGELVKEDIIGKVIYSDLDQVGLINTSDEKINRLFLNCLWGQKSNFIDFPTDCPQRDERLAWTGDAQVFAGTASYNMDTRAFYNKFLHDLRVEQKKHNGIVPGFIPVFGQPIACSVWGDIGTFLPTVLFDHYGDKSSLETHYPMMKDWVDYITVEDVKRGQKYLYDFGSQIGDWLAQDGRSPQSFKGGTDDHFIASSYYYESTRLVAEAAGVLGNTIDEEKYRNLSLKIKEAILNEYFTPAGRLSIDTQTGYLVALNFGLYVEKEKIVEGLKERLYKDCNKLTGGFVGAPIMCRVMAENGLVEEALDFIFQEEFPSWLYCVNLGATTIWERWNSVLEDGSMSGTIMNSLNHYAYGAVVEYLYRDLGGIRPLEAGFKKVLFEPQINGKFQYFTAEYNSISGKYTSLWKINEDGSVSIRFEVPFARTAEVKLPEYKEEILHLEAGIHEFSYFPKKNYKSIFSVNTRLTDLVKHPQALEILERRIPFVTQMITQGDADGMSHSLSNLKRLVFFGINPDDVEKAAEEILMIER